MRQDKGDARDAGPAEVDYETPEHVADTPVDFVPDDDLEYTGENGDGQEVRVPPDWS